MAGVKMTTGRNEARWLRHQMKKERVRFWWGEVTLERSERIGWWPLKETLSHDVEMVEEESNNRLGREQCGRCLILCWYGSIHDYFLHNFEYFRVLSCGFKYSKLLPRGLERTKFNFACIRVHELFSSDLKLFSSKLEIIFMCFQVREIIVQVIASYPVVISSNFE